MKIPAFLLPLGSLLMAACSPQLMPPSASDATLYNLQGQALLFLHQDRVRNLQDQELAYFDGDTLRNLGGQRLGQVAGDRILNLQGQELGRVTADHLINLHGQAIMRLEGAQATDRAKLAAAFFFLL